MLIGLKKHPTYKYESKTCGYLVPWEKSFLEGMVFINVVFLSLSFLFFLAFLKIRQNKSASSLFSQAPEKAFIPTSQTYIYNLVY